MGKEMKERCERHNTLKRDGGEKEEKEEDDQNTTELDTYHHHHHDATLQRYGRGRQPPVRLAVARVHCPPIPCYGQALSVTHPPREKPWPSGILAWGRTIGSLVSSRPMTLACLPIVFGTVLTMERTAPRLNITLAGIFSFSLAVCL